MGQILFDNLAGESGLYFDALTSAPTTNPVVSAIADGDVYPGETGVVITGTSFGASQGAGTVTLGGVEQTVTAWADTSITITVVLGTAGYGANDLVVTDDGAAASDAYSVTLSPATGYEYVELTSVHATASERLTSSPDLAVGDQIEWSNVVGTGAVTVYDDGTFSADEGVLSFDFRVWDSASPSWGASATQLVEPSVVPDIVNSTEAAALAAIASASMIAGTVDSSYDAVVPDGSVKAQGTAADEVVLRGASLDYTLSDGPTPVTVPDVVGLTVAAATTAIEGAGLVVGSQASSYSSSVASGLVISQTQTAGSELPGGSAVDILVSLGAWAGSIQRSPWMFGFSFLFGGGGGGSAAWTPASLFASGEVGAWYDPSDLNLMYSDMRGTKVTAVETAVAYILDKAHPDVDPTEIADGSCCILTDAYESATPAGWTGGSVSAESTEVYSGSYSLKYDGSADASIGIASLGIPSDSGNVIRKFSFYAKHSGTGNAVAFRLQQYSGGGVVKTVLIPNTATSWTLYEFESTTDNSADTFVITGAGTVYFDALSVKNYVGNHAYQATAASRPVLRARYNLLTYSERFDNAAWGGVNQLETANATTAPDGTTTADKVASTNSNVGYWQQAVSAANGSAIAFSIYAKAAEFSWIEVLTSDGGTAIAAWFDLANGVTGTVQSGQTAQIESVGSGWYRCIILRTSASASAGLFRIFPTNADNTQTQGNGSSGVYLWGAQYEEGVSSAGPYQRIAAATDYVTSSTMEDYDFPYYLDFDGVDDLLTCGNPDLSTDATVAFSIPATGDSIAENQTIGANYSLNTDCCAFVLLDRNLAGSESTDLAAYLDAAAGVTP